MNFFRDFKSQKRGVSGVITAVLLILLVIAAIGILWVVVQNFVQEGSSGVTGAADCLTTSFEVVSASAESTIGDDATITIRKTAGSVALTEIRISDGDKTLKGTTANPAVGVTSTTPTGANNGFGFGEDIVDVSIAFDLADGTSCPLENLGSVTAE